MGTNPPNFYISKEQTGVMACFYNHNPLQAEVEDCKVKASLGSTASLCFKNQKG